MLVHPRARGLRAKHAIATLIWAGCRVLLRGDKGLVRGATNLGCAVIVEFFTSYGSLTGGPRSNFYGNASRERRARIRKLMWNAKKSYLTSPTKPRCTTTTNRISKQYVINNRRLRLTKVNIPTNRPTKTYYQNARLLMFYGKARKPRRGKGAGTNKIRLTSMGLAKNFPL